MDVGKMLSDAWKAVEESGVPKELQETAFTRALDLMVGAAPPSRPPIVAAASPPPGPAAAVVQPVAAAGASADGVLTDDQLYAKLHQATGVDISKFENVLHMDEASPHLSVSSKRLPESKKAARLLIAKLILIARNIGLGEQEVPIAEIRKVCDAYSLADSNFSTDMKTLKSVDGIMMTGDGKKLKVRRTFTDKFSEVLDELVTPAS